ncbi:hypothetical protein N9901_03160, partial [Flavobacteriaceae bacterium]|nr:hypothetical protein [Flavobacteriaceae bacterium]
FAMDDFEVKTVSPVAVQTIIETMDSNLNYLTALSFNTLEIDDALSEVHYYWSQLKNSLYFNGNVSLIKTEMDGEKLFDLCNTVLGKANTATKMYADLNKS